MRDVSVVTVDDQAVYRATARDVIEATAGFRIVGEASSGEDGMKVVAELAPEVVLMDVRMPGIDGIQAAQRIKAAHPSTMVILISIEEAANLPAELSESGADAFVRKQDFRPALLRELWEAHGGPVPAE